VLFAFIVSGLVSSVLCQGIGYEEHLRNDLFFVELDVKPSNTYVHRKFSQGSHSPGKPGKLLEFYVRPGIFGIISRFMHIKAKYSAYVFTTYFLQQVLTLIAFSYVW